MTSRTIEPAQARDGFQVLRKEMATQQYVLQLAAGPAAKDCDRYAAKLLATVLGDDSGSRLFWELVDPGLAEHASLSHGEHEGAGMLMTYMTCDPEHATGNLQRIFEVYRAPRPKASRRPNWSRPRTRSARGLVLSSERPRGRLFAVGNDWVYRREYRPVESELGRGGRRHVADIAAILAKYPLTRATTVAIGPLAELPTPC